VEAEWTLEAWRDFVANRDAGAGMLWALAIVIGLIVRALPERWRAWGVSVVSCYAVVMVLWLL